VCVSTVGCKALLCLDATLSFVGHHRRPAARGGAHPFFSTILGDIGLALVVCRVFSALLEDSVSAPGGRRASITPGAARLLDLEWRPGVVEARVRARERGRTGSLLGVQVLSEGYWAACGGRAIAAKAVSHGQAAVR